MVNNLGAYKQDHFVFQIHVNEVCYKGTALQ